LVGALALLLCASGSAVADDITIDFYGGRGGVLTWAGGNSALVGSGINIGSLQGVGTEQHSTADEIAMFPQFADGSFEVVGGRLNFETGGFTGYGGDHWLSFGGGGTFSITGAVRDHTGGYIIADSSTELLRGYMLGADVDRVGNIKLTIVQGTDTKHPALVSWFGLPANTMFEFSGEIAADRWTGVAGQYQVASSRITNTVVPEPATITLLGSILFLVGTRLRRKTR
jgi:hypothetical protein